MEPGGTVGYPGHDRTAGYRIQGWHGEVRRRLRIRLRRAYQTRNVRVQHTDLRGAFSARCPHGMDLLGWQRLDLRSFYRVGGRDHGRERYQQLRLSEREIPPPDHGPRVLLRHSFREYVHLHLRQPDGPLHGTPAGI